MFFPRIFILIALRHVEQLAGGEERASHRRFSLDLRVVTPCVFPVFSSDFNTNPHSAALFFSTLLGMAFSGDLAPSFFIFFAASLLASSSACDSQTHLSNVESNPNSSEKISSKCVPDQAFTCILSLLMAFCLSSFRIALCRSSSRSGKVFRIVSEELR